MAHMHWITNTYTDISANIMAAFRDDMPLIAGVDADWDDMNI